MEQVPRAGELDQAAGRQRGEELVAATQPRRATRLLGAAAAAVEATGPRVHPANQADHERSLATARRLLGDAAFDAAWAQGRSLTLEQAVAEALATG